MSERLLSCLILIVVSLTCRSQTWSEWLRNSVRTNTSQNADRIVGMLAVLEQGHRMVSQSGVVDLSYENCDVSTDLGLTSFACQVAKDIHLPYGKVSAQYSRNCRSVQIESDVQTGSLKVEVGFGCQDKPTVAKGLICRMLSGLRIDWNVIGSHVPEEFKGSSKGWEWELREINAACLGLGGVLLESTEVKSIVDGTTKQRSCTRHMNLMPADLAWTVAAVKLLRKQELVLSCSSDLAKTAWIVGKTSAVANAARTRDQMESFVANLDKGVPLALPGTDHIWQDAVADSSLFQGLVEKSESGRIEKTEPIKIDIPEVKIRGIQSSVLPTAPLRLSQDHSASCPEYVQPTSEEVREWWQKRIVPLPQTQIPDRKESLEAKVRIKEVVARIRAETRDEDERVNRIARLAQDAKGSGDRFFAFREAVSAAIAVKNRGVLRRLFWDLVAKDGAEYALEVVKPYRLRIGNMAEITETEKAIGFLRKNETALASVDADQALLAWAAKCYLTLGAVTNAHAAFACSDVKLDRLMRLTEGEKFRVHRGFWWKPPFPEFDVAEFWHHAAQGNPVFKPYCDQMCEIWSEKALQEIRCSDHMVFKPIKPLWMTHAQEWTCGRGCVKRDKWWNNLYYIDWKEFRFFADEGRFDKKFVYEEEGVWEDKRGHRPSSYWLKQCDPFCWGQNGVRTLVVPVRSMPLRDSDFDEKVGKLPSKANLDKALFAIPKKTEANFRTWVARYYDLPDNRVKLVNVTQRELRKDGYGISLVKFAQVNAQTVGALIQGRVNGQVYFLEVRTEQDQFVDDELFKCYVRDIRLSGKVN